MNFSVIAAIVGVAAAISGVVYAEMHALAVVLLIGFGLATRVILTGLEQRVRDALLTSGALNARLKFELTLVLITLSAVVGLGFSAPLAAYEDGVPVQQGLVLGAITSAVLWNRLVNRQRRILQPVKPGVEPERAVAPQSDGSMPAAPSRTSYILAPFFGLALTIVASFVLIASDTGGDYAPRGLVRAFDWFLPMWVGFTFMVVAVQERLFMRLARWVTEHQRGSLSMAIGAIVAVVAGAFLYRLGVTSEEIHFWTDEERAQRLRFVALCAAPLGIVVAVAMHRFLQRRSKAQ